MNHWKPPRATEIDRKLREDFCRLLKDEHGRKQEITDPILAVLFRSFALQIESIYREAGEAIPLALLDELIAGLGMPERRSQPAQTVVQFSFQEGYEEREVFESGTELLGEAKSGERLVFATDATVQVSGSRIVFAGTYRDGMLRLFSGMEYPKEFERVQPALQPFPARLGPSSCVLLGIDLGDSGHLDHHGVYFDLALQSRHVFKQLEQEVWCLLDDQGLVRPEGMLQAQTANGGVRQLEWVVPPQDIPEATAPNSVPDGFYGRRVFVFPAIPADRRFRIGLPGRLTEPILQIFGKEASQLFSKPRAWVQIVLPELASHLDEDIARIVLNCVTASNVELLNETLYLRSTGTSVPISREGGTNKHLVAPVSVRGERGLGYADEAEPVIDENAGRYRFRKGRIEIEPARSPTGVPDKLVNLRLLVSDGALANDVEVGSVTGFLRRVESPSLQLTNIAAAAGGTDNIPYGEAKDRFAELLLCRERLITRADYEAVVRAFEPKVRAVKINSALAVSLEGLRRVQRVTISLARQSFVDPDIESFGLQRELQSHLQQRALLDLEIRVVIEWLGNSSEAESSTKDRTGS